MMETRHSIVVRNISKSYKRFEKRLHRYLSWFGMTSFQYEEIKVLNHITFSLFPGEAVALIGENGAGKSTLLKTITGTIQANEGDIVINGRVSAILELGLGFNQEMTGRQNVFLSGAVMGYGESELHSLMDSIKDFSELNDYFEQPVKTYSSGMQMRLAFSIATATRPEILIIDEALSVGDAYFQHKSFSRIKQFREQGTTLLFVSHDRYSVQTLCDRAILLERGSVLIDAEPEQVMDYYNALIAQKEETKDIIQEKLPDGRVKTSSGTGEAKILRVSLLDENKKSIEFVEVGQRVSLKIEVEIHEDIPRLVLGYGIKDRLGTVVYGTNTDLTDNVLQSVQRGSLLTYVFEFDCNLGSGSYSIQTALHSTETHLVNNYHWQELALIFNVTNNTQKFFVGCNWMPPIVKIDGTLG